MRFFFTLAILGLVSFSPAGTEKPKQILLLGQGPDGHPKGAHEYFLGLKILEATLKNVPNLEVKIVNADDPWRDGPALLEKADGVVFYLAEGAKWFQKDEAQHQAFKKFAARKGGVVVLHWAMGTREAKYIDGFVELAGGCHGGPDRKYKELTTEIQAAEAKHPVTTGITKLKLRDEFYYQLKFPKDSKGLTPLVKAAIDGKQETVAWAWERPGGGRSFGFSGLHFHEHWQLPEYRRLVAQGVVWSVGLPIPAEGLKIELGTK